MQEGQITVYRSSAGSGKTYQLALNYLCLALQAPGSFKNILAVTFTNKATREMKERILLFLKELANNENQVLLEHVMQSLSWTGDRVTARARDALSEVLHAYGNFSVTTIDSFFQKIIRSFARELGLLGNYQVELDLSAAKDIMIDLTIGDAGKDPSLTRWLVQFAENRVDDGAGWNIRGEIEKLAGEIFTEQFKILEPALVEHISKPDFIHGFLNKLNTSKKAFEAKVDRLAEKGQEIISTHGLLKVQFKQGARGPASLFERVLQDKIYQPNSYMLKAFEDPDQWHKNDQNTGAILMALDAGLKEVYTKIFDLFREERPLYLGVKEVLRNVYTFGILARLIAKLQAYREERDVMLISDVNQFLKGVIGENHAPFIYEKTGTWFRNFLIDEFQDTSAFQWFNFKPLIDNSLAEGHANMLVGDVKQSIYRWRGGDWELLQFGISESIARHHLQYANLDRNFRSKKKLIAFNNALFQSLPEMLSGHMNAKIDRARQLGTANDEFTKEFNDYKGIYRDARQSVGNDGPGKAGGYVRIEFSDEFSKKSDWKQSVLESLPGTLKKLVANGYRAEDIAILVRKADEGSEIINHMIDYRSLDADFDIQILSNESLFLNASKAVRLLIQGIRIIYHPEDLIGRAIVIHEYLKHVSVENLPDHEIFNISQDMEAIAKHPELGPIFNEFEHLKHFPILEQAEKLIRVFELEKSEENFPYLIAFEDALLNYTHSNDDDIPAFLEWWEDKGQFLGVQLPENTDAVRILTVHKSKGLEFKVVLIPFCSWQLDHIQSFNNIIWCSSNQEPLNEINAFPISYNSHLINTVYCPDYLREFARIHIDNLNLLYVAMTRAEEVLMVNCLVPIEERRKKNQLRTVSDLLLAGIENGQVPNNGDDLSIDLKDHFSNSDMVFEFGSIRECREKTKHRVQFLNTFHTNNWDERISIKMKSANFFEKEEDERRKKVNYGIVVHRILAGIVKAQHADMELQKLVYEGVLNQEELQSVQKDVREILDNPEVRPWFDGSWIVRTEQEILQEQKGSSKPDRVMIKDDKAVVIDFKTGQAYPAHKGQVLDYRKLLMQMGFQRVEAFLLYTSENKVIQVA